ncbi:MAG: translocation/assembly module TamB domain-containing protein, partial [Myxococcota bacterium]
AHHLGAVARSLLGEGPARDLAEPTTWVDDVSLDVVPLRLPVQALAGLVEGLPTSLTGDLSGGLHVSGGLRAPTVEGALLLADGRLGELAVSPAMVSVGAVEGGYRVDADLGFGNRGGVTVGGFVPFAPTLAGDLAAELARPGLALDVRGDALPLEAIAAAWPEMEATSGVLSLNGTVGGSLAAPAPDLAFGLVDGDFSLAFTGVRYRDAAFSGRLLPDSLAVENLSVRTVRLDWAGTPSEGTITGGVTARRVDDRPVFEGALRLVNAWIVDVPDQTLRVDGHLRLADRAHALRVSGKLSVVEGNLVVPERFFAGTSDLALAPDVRVYRRGVTRRAATVEEASELRFPTWLDAEITVALDRNAFLAAQMPMEQVLGQVFRSFSSIEIATQLDGEVLAVIEDGALSLIGEVRPLRGTARVFSRPFELQGETISFTGRDWMDPVLDLVAVHESEYGPITTKITGTPSALRLAFDAEDPTLAGEDVLSVLVLGSRTSEIAAGEGQGLSGVFSLATSGALGLLNQQVAGGGAFTLDLFEVDIGGLRFGKRIGEDLFVVGEYEWEADATEENVGEVTLEWQVGRHWQFELTTGTSSFSSLGFTRRWRF